MELVVGVLIGIGIIIGLMLGGAAGWLAQGARGKTRLSAQRLEHDQAMFELQESHRNQMSGLEVKVAGLEGQLEQVSTAQQMLDTAKEQLSAEFQAAAGKALQSNNEHFVRLANENLGKTLESAKSEFHQRHQQFQELVKPLSENYGRLNPQIETLTTQVQAVTSETAKLSGALTSNQQVGNWGEVQLRRIVELAGMSDYADFSEQENVLGGRPDLIVRLPDQRTVVVDAKASMTAHLEASQAGDEAAADAAWTKHARALKSQIDDLNRKDYGSSVAGSLNFVVMFVPGDQFLASALKADAGLVEYAIGKRVAIAKPASLIAMLWAVANGWERVRLAQNTETIRQAGEEMHKRMLTFVNHYQGVGKNLGEAVDCFNRSIGSFENRVLPQGRKFAELVTGDAENFSVPPVVEKEVRESRYGVVADDAKQAAD